jgi:general secretion pathway protein A
VYQSFYRFSRDPFAAPADARHIFMAAGHRDALSGVVLDVLKRRPFVAVGGDGEVGKTTVLNAALASLTDQRRRRPVRITRLDHSRLTSLSARQIVAQLIGKRTGELIDHDLQHLFHTLTDCGKDGRQHVLVIDDAPSVNPGALEFLRLVVGLQTLDRTSLQVVLAGRNEFWETLIGDSGWATHDRVTNRAAVEPLADDEVRQYIDYRLQLADSSVERVVTDAALGDIIRHGQALPGRINRILDRAFTVGATQGFSRVTPRVVDEAVMFLEASNLLPPAPLAPGRRPATRRRTRAPRRGRAGRPQQGLSRRPPSGAPPGWRVPRRRRSSGSPCPRACCCRGSWRISRRPRSPRWTRSRPRPLRSTRPRPRANPRRPIPPPGPPMIIRWQRAKRRPRRCPSPTRP